MYFAYGKNVNKSYQRINWGGSKRGKNDYEFL